MDSAVIEKQDHTGNSGGSAASGTGVSLHGGSHAGIRQPLQTDSFAPGDRVKSAVHGEGTVLSVSPMGADFLMEIAFDQVGTKKIMAKYARIRKVSS